MKNAPHLPPKTCRVDTYQRLQNIKWILLFGVFAFIAGGSAALIFNAWLVPNYSFTQLWTTGSIDSRAGGGNQPDALLQRQVEQRVLAIHDKRKKAGGEFYSKESFVANAAVVSSDGWAVASVSNYYPGMEKNWEIADYQRVSYKIEQTAFDRLEHLLYFKVKGEGLRVVSFPKWSDLNVGAVLWSVGFSGWRQTFIEDNVKMTEKNLFTIWQPQYNFRVGDDIALGDLLFNEKGELAAVAGENNFISHGWLIEIETGALLSSGRLSYRGLPWQGYFIHGSARGEASNVAGFYVEKSLATASADSVGRGDIVLKVNGEAANEERLAEQVWLAPNEFKVIVLRAGQEIEMTVKKVMVQP